MPAGGMTGKTSGADKDALANELRALRKQVTDLRSALARDVIEMIGAAIASYPNQPTA